MNKILKLNRFDLNLLPVRHNASLQSFKNHLKDQLDSIRSAGTFKNERVIVSKQGSHIQVSGINEQILNFCANNYMGLSVINQIF